MNTAVHTAGDSNPGNARNPGKKPRSTEPLKLLKFAAKYWPLVLLGPLFMVLEVSVDLFQPRMMEVIVDRGILGIGNGGLSDIHLVISTGIRMILLVIAGGCFGILSGVCANVAGQSFGNNIRKACFTRIMHFSFEQTDAFSTGSLITRITNDVTQIQQLFMQAIRGFVRCMMFFVGGTVALLTLDLSFGQVLLIAFPLIFLDVIFVFIKTNPLFSLLQKKLDDLNNIIQENVSGIRVVKAFVQEKHAVPGGASPLFHAACHEYRPQSVRRGNNLRRLAKGAGRLRRTRHRHGRSHLYHPDPERHDDACHDLSDAVAGDRFRFPSFGDSQYGSCHHRRKL